MKQYFSLQFKFINRKFIELGINPLLGYSIGTAVVVLLSNFIFLRTEFAKYLILLISFNFIISSSGTKRIEFLRLVFGDRKSLLVRILENLIICIPFLLILIFHNVYLESVLLIIGVIVFAKVSVNKSNNYTLPTPFYKYPFEFAVGFRSTFFVFPLAYLLTFVAIMVDNFNLGLFALLFTFLIALTFYAKPENEYYVWSYSTKPTKFLLKKICTASLYCSYLVLPIVCALILFYSSEIYLILMAVMVGYIFLWMIILSKYSTYPNDINLPEGIMIALCIYMPLLLIIILPYLYFKSIRKLNAILK